MKKNFLLALALCACGGLALSAQPRSASQPKLLIKSESGLMAPLWSPTGDRIAVTTNNYTGILVADADGKALTSVTNLSGAGYKMQWSADGSRIMGRTNITENNRVFHEVKVWNISDGSEQTVVAKTRALNGTPVWDNENVIVSEQSGSKAVNIRTKSVKPAASLNVYTIMMNDPTNAAKRIAGLKQFEGKMVINPALSADGSMVAFQIPGKGIYSCTVAGENVRFITKGSHPAWLPDGKTIVYTDVKDDGNRFTESYIMAVNTATMASVQLAGGTDIIPLTPSVSPDGMKVAFENAADAAIYVITLKY